MASKGSCYLCGAEMGKVAMKNHILKYHSGAGEGQECRLLKIEGAYDKDLLAVHRYACGQDAVCAGPVSPQDMAGMLRTSQPV